VALLRHTDGTYRARAPADVVELLNELVLDEMDTEHYFTMILAQVDLSTGRIEVAQAGHPHPLIQRADGRIEQEGTGGFPVGLLSGAAFEQFELTLAPGDRLLLLSDGVTECPMPDAPMLGETGLEALVRDLQHLVGQNFLEALIWRLSEISGHAEFPDDVSGILLEYRGR
jgi:sigma-B regulation protein RsbU (phosphoserine phosphatase)